MPHEWQLVDLTTGLTMDVESGTPAEFAVRHGDGAGFVVTGFGCDGQAFNVDAVTGNGRVWDFEGLALATSIVPSATQLVAGEQLDGGRFGHRRRRPDHRRPARPPVASPRTGRVDRRVPVDLLGPDGSRARR